MALRFWSYSMNSSIARTIAARLGARVIRHQGSTYRYRSGDFIVNWGSTLVPARYPVDLNLPDKVAIACSKMRTFQALDAARVPTLQWTTDASIAASWFNLGSAVYARTADTGARGIGINVIRPSLGDWESQLANASATGNIRFFTRRVRNKREFRIYVVGNQVTSILEKRRRTGMDADPFVRSHGNNWVFALGLRGPIQQDVSDACVQATQAVGLDFAGVDVVLCAESGRPVILEVNSAPGVDAPTSQTQFVEALRTLIQQRSHV